MNNQSNDNIFAPLSVILSGVLWGIISLFIKNLSAAGLDALQISFIRMAVAAPAFTLFMLAANRDKMKINPKDFYIFIGTGIVSIVLFNSCYFYTMIHSQASVAVVLLYTSPVFIMLLSALFFKEKITPTKLVALILTLTGCVLVTGLAGGGYRLKPFILFTGLLSGLAYGLYTIFGRVALKKYDTMTVTMWTFIFALPASAIIGKPAETFREVSGSPKLILLSLGIGVFSTVLPYFFYTWGLKRMDGGRASILVAVEPVVGAVIGMTLFNESRSIIKIAGILLVIAAIVLMNISLPSKKKE